MLARNRTVLVLVAVAVAMLGLTTTLASADIILKVDFNSNQDGGGDSTTAGDPSLSEAAHNQEGWSSYHANHEVIAEFTTADYDGITVTPDWPNTTANTVRQSIDRGSGNDDYWDDAAGDLNLVTDFIGIDTRTGNAGNGDWDGTTGTPTYMTLALGGLAAGNYDWTSFHHDTEHVFGPFAVWISTDGGETFTQLDDGIMTDSTPAGTPDSGATEVGPDANSLPSTYHTSFKADGTNDVVFRFAPYSEGEVHRQIWGMNGFMLNKGISLGVATAETPANQATDVPYNMPLSWTAGQFAQTHDVYVGTAFDDVNDASGADGMGVLVSQGQTETSYASETAWEFGQTYYWRVDEVNGAPDNAIYNGEVWSFTVEPLSYAIEGVVVTSNGIADAGADPENAVNGSGLDADELHSTESTDMWLATPVDEPLTITFEFDRVYKMHEMLVWNYNVQFELMLGFGVKDATVEYSTDGAEWAVLGDVVLAQATAQSGYAANTTVDLQGVPAQYVRLTVNSGYGTVGKFGLSEVRFMQIPAQAREPQPADEAADVAVSDTVLSWRAGREAVTHEVYLGTDPDALELFDTTSATTLDPGALDLGATYYWRIDEVNEADDISVWEGRLWSFSTQPYIVVDDFESYTDDEGGRIYEIWADGWVNDTGATVGYFEAPFAEQTIVNSGTQSMPLFYDNSGVATSEADLELSQDWTTNGIKTLSLMFYGAADNSGQLYIRINNTKVAYDNAADDIKASQWQAWNIDLTALSGLQNVTSLTIGIEGAGAAGTLYIDDIRLYPLPGELVVPTEPSADGLVAHLSFDEGSGTTAADSSGNDNHGDVVGDAQWVAGKVGGALAFDGVDDMVVVNQNSGLPIYNNGTDNAYSIAMWVKGGPQNDMRVFSEGSTTSGTPLVNLGTHNAASPTGQFAAFIRPDSGTTLNHPLSQAEPFDDTWHHIAWVDDNGTATLYVDGLLDGGEFNYTRGTMALDTTSIGGILRADPSHWFTGQIDEVRIYSRALSAGEALGLAGKTQPIHKPF